MTFITSLENKKINKINNYNIYTIIIRKTLGKWRNMFTEENFELQVENIQHNKQIYNFLITIILKHS